MRILLVHNYYQQAGGEDTVFEQEVALLRENGLVVETLVFDNEAFGGTLAGDVKAAMRAFYNTQSAHRIRASIQNFRPDVIHIHNLFYTASAAVIRVSKQYGLPVVMTLHNYRLICINGLLMRPEEIPCERCLDKTVALSGIRHACFQGSRLKSAHLSAITMLHKLTGIWKSVDRFIVMTEFARQKILASSLHLNPDQVWVKPNFVANSGFSESNHRENFFLFVGRLSFEKGIHTLLEAAQQNTIPLQIIGDGPLEAEVRQAAMALPHLHYQGKQSKAAVLDAMRTCRALVVPSICYESALPLVMLEAFATGTPIICSDQPNFNRPVANSGAGLLFQTGNSLDLDRVMQKVYVQPLTEHVRLAENAFREFRTRYTSEVSLQAMLLLYRQVTGHVETKF